MVARTARLLSEFRMKGGPDPRGGTSDERGEVPPPSSGSRADDDYGNDKSAESSIWVDDQYMHVLRNRKERQVRSDDTLVYVYSRSNCFPHSDAGQMRSRLTVESRGGRLNMVVLIE